MRTVRTIIMLLLAATLLGGLAVGCVDTTYESGFTQETYETDPEAGVGLMFVVREQATQGCTMLAPKTTTRDQTAFVEKWTVEPSDGASVAADGTFTASKPGEYTVSALFSGTTYTTKVIVSHDGGVTVTPGEQGPPDPFVGGWTWMTRNALQDPVSMTYYWADQGPYDFVVEKTGETYTLGGTGGPVQTCTFDGTTVTIAFGDASWSAAYSGTLAGDTITGTATYKDADLGSETVDWVATRVK